MIYIVLSICINALIFVIFKLFSKYRVDTFQAIVFNYIFAFIVALFQNTSDFSITDVPNKPWFFVILILGFLFITLFNVVAKTIQKMGFSVVAVSSKMSVIIPIIFGVIIYNEKTGTLKLIGILLALIAVFLSSVKKNNNFDKNYIYLPILLFFGSGILDTLLKYFETNYVAKNELSLYTGSIFLVAGIIGFIVIIFKLIKKQTKLAVKNIVAGIVLGVPNYFSIYFLLKALSINEMDSSTVFTINNVGIVLLSTLVGLLLFKEKLSRLNYFGIIISIIAILLITLSS